MWVDWFLTSRYRNTPPFAVAVAVVVSLFASSFDSAFGHKKKGVERKGGRGCMCIYACRREMKCALEDVRKR